MSTYVRQHLLESFERWSEYNTVYQLAEQVYESHSGYYAIHYKTAIIFAVGYFESFVKGLAKACADDLNTLAKFSDLPKSIQRTVRYHLTPQSIEDGKARESICTNFSEYFKNSANTLPRDAFVVQNKFGNDSTNPSPDLITKIAENLGVKKPFSKLRESKFDQIFSFTPSETSAFIDSAKQKILIACEQFPYAQLDAEFGFSSTASNQGTGLLEEFINNILLCRHKVAHGDSGLSPESLAALKETELKMKALQLALCALIATELSKQLSPSPGAS